MYAVVRTGGKQVRVSPGQAVRVERLPGAVGDRIELAEVLMVGGEGDARVGQPVVAGAKVVGTITAQGRGPKITISSRTTAKYGASRASAGITELGSRRRGIGAWHKKGREARARARQPGPARGLKRFASTRARGQLLVSQVGTRITRVGRRHRRTTRSSPSRTASCTTASRAARSSRASSPSSRRRSPPPAKQEADGPGLRRRGGHRGRGGRRRERLRRLPPREVRAPRRAGRRRRRGRGAVAAEPRDAPRQRYRACRTGRVRGGAGGCSGANARKS